jgi:hypothetical protein
VASAPIVTASPPAERTVSWWLVLAGATAIAALSLLASRQTTYDPTAWLIWGREILHGDLSTTAGPSWKPLPVIVTTPAAILGDAAQQQIWLVVARAGGLVAVVLAYRLAWRLGGRAAGLIAACALALSGGFASHVVRGDSEGLLAALALGAVEAHVSDRRRLAFALLVATGLLRPEMWLLIVTYGAWLAWSEGRSLRIAAGVGAAVALGLALWLIPEQIGSGDLLRAASRAREPVADSPAQAAHPFVATFTNAAPVLPWPVYVGGAVFVLAALAAARRERRLSLPLALAATATVLMVVVAAMAQGGFTGNTRYLTIPIALTCVLSGGGWAWIARTARSRLSARQTTAAGVVVVLVAAPFVVRAVDRLVDDMRGAFHEARVYAALPDAIARAGGRAAVLRCGTVFTAATDTQTVARNLRVHEYRVGIHPRAPGTIVARRGSSLAGDRGFSTLAGTRRWVIASSCRSRP